MSEQQEKLCHTTFPPTALPVGVSRLIGPKNWSDSKIKEAGNYVTNLPDNKNLPDGVIGYGEYDGVRVGIIKTDGKIGTIFPDADLQP